MTARTMLTDPLTCCAGGCGLGGAFRLGILLWAPTDANHKGEPLELCMPLYVCEHHRDNMPSTPGSFLPEETRARIAHELNSIGKATPDFSTAAFNFDPLPPTPRKAAH